MSVLDDFAKKRAEKRKMTSHERDIYFATLSNDKTKADEILLFVRYFLLPLSAIWVAYVGNIHLSKELVGVVPDEHVWWIALGIPVVFQCIKAYCATTVFRAFHFRWYDNSKADFWIYTILAAITLFAFIWTLKISFWDVKETAKSNFVDKNTISLDAHLKAATADVDAQIMALSQKQAQTGSARWKNGKVDWAAQPIVAENAKTESALSTQRSTIVEAATKEFNEKKQRIEQQSQKSGGFFQRFGGYGELLEILCFILCGLLEKKMHKINTDDEEEEAKHSALPPHQQHSHNGNGQQHQQYQNKGRFTYFNRQDDGQVRNAYGDDVLHPINTTVSQSPLPVSQTFAAEDGDHADDVLALAMKRLKGFDDLFDQKHRNNETVAQNIHDILDQVLFKMKGTFRPSVEVHAKFSTYTLETLFPLLHEKQFRYPRQMQFEHWLRTVSPMPVG